MIDFDALVLAPIMGAFGEPVIYQTKAGGNTQLTGVFDERFQEEVWQNDVPTMATRPRLGCQLSALPQLPVEGDRFIIRGGLWIVRTVHPDGIGHLAITLNGPM